MEQIMQQTLDIGPSIADVEGLLSYSGAFHVFQDLAAAHAERLGVGLGAMAEQSLFWLTVRTKIVFLSRPALGEAVTLRTWPEKPVPSRQSTRMSKPFRSVSSVKGTISTPLDRARSW